MRAGGREGEGMRGEGGTLGVGAGGRELCTKLVSEGGK